MSCSLWVALSIVFMNIQIWIGRVHARTHSHACVLSVPPFSRFSRFNRNEIKKIYSSWLSESGEWFSVCLFNVFFSSSVIRVSMHKTRQTICDICFVSSQLATYRNEEEKFEEVEYAVRANSLLYKFNRMRKQNTHTHTHSRTQHKMRAHLKWDWNRIVVATCACTRRALILLVYILTSASSPARPDQILCTFLPHSKWIIRILFAAKESWLCGERNGINRWKEATNRTRRLESKLEFFLVSFWLLIIFGNKSNWLWVVRL